MQTAKFFTGTRITLLLIFAIIAFVLGSFISTRMHKPLAQQLSATLLPQPQLLTPFKLTDTQNKPFTNQDLQGHWTLLFFGFTHCGKVCPTTLGVLSQVHDKLETDKQVLPKILFVSIDPERDTSATIKKYLSSFNPAFQGATGSDEQIEKLTQELSILYMKVKQPGADIKNIDDYQIDHSGTVLLINPTGALYAVFSMPHDAASMTKDLETIATYANHA